MNMIGKRIDELSKIIETSKIISYDNLEKNTEFIHIGSKVTILNGNQIQKYFIGGTHIFREETSFEGFKVVSTKSPIGSSLIDASANEYVNIQIGKKISKVKILKTE